MVRWYHAIFTAYGFWLPNDPRGSWSDFVASWNLYKFGGSATTTDARRSVAHTPHNASMRRDAKQQLQYPSVRFDEVQRQCIAEGVAQACDESHIDVHAFAIGYDHSHAIVARHTKSIEDIVHHFKSRATKHMRRAGAHPLKQFTDRSGVTPTPWAEKFWRVYINDENQLYSAIEYVERHPHKEGLLPTTLAICSPRLAGGPCPPRSVARLTHAAGMARRLNKE